MSLMFLVLFSILIPISIAQNQTQGMEMNVTTTKPPTTVVTTISPALTTLAATAQNATSTFVTQCGKISNVSQTVKANSYYNNGSCFIAVYSPNVAYTNVSTTCRNISRQTNSTADCQMLHTISAASIRNFITNGLVQSTDSFYMGVSRDSCNSTWHWDNAGGSKTDVATNSSDFFLLPGGAIGGATNTTPTNVLLCECRTDYSSTAIRPVYLSAVLITSIFVSLATKIV
ncbi:hypothetical protein M3Y96_00258300 [Aphelenchoides besseyi]|nr:hypothetical protein M3Y96_00258300 [Aphelenchoides besseyi]